MKTLSLIAASLVLLSSTAAQAVPWCWRGTIVEIQDVTWNGSQILTNFGGGPVPGGVLNPDYFKAYTAATTYASSFAGGGGGFGGYSVPGSGEVLVFAYAPTNYTNGPIGSYNVAQGISFKLKKCYTIVPLTAVAFDVIALPDVETPIVGKPYKGLGGLRKYMERAPEDCFDPTGETLYCESQPGR